MAPETAVPVAGSQSAEYCSVDICGESVLELMEGVEEDAALATRVHISSQSPVHLPCISTLSRLPPISP